MEGKTYQAYAVDGVSAGTIAESPKFDYLYQAIEVAKLYARKYDGWYHHTAITNSDACGCEECGPHSGFDEDEQEVLEQEGLL